MLKKKSYGRELASLLRLTVNYGYNRRHGRAGYPVKDDVVRKITTLIRTDDYTLSLPGAALAILYQVVILGLLYAHGIMTVSAYYLEQVAAICRDERLTLPKLAAYVEAAISRLPHEAILPWYAVYPACRTIRTLSRHTKYWALYAVFLCAVSLAWCYTPADPEQVVLIIRAVKGLSPSGRLTIFDLYRIADRYLLVDPSHRQRVNESL